MGQSATAYLRFGYVLPEREYPDDYDWDTHGDDERDPESIWFETFGPAEVKALDLSQEETDEWNALPSEWSRPPATPEQVAAKEAFSAKYGVFLDAKREWLKSNPCEVASGKIGSYEGEDEFLYYKGPGQKYSDEIGLSADWEATPVKLDDPIFDFDREHAKAKLDEVCRLLGCEPEQDPEWHIYPVYG